jgi:hypothetical protein
MTLPTPSDRATGCASDGKSHLNLTRTMADVWGIKPEPEVLPMVVSAPVVSKPKPKPKPKPKAPRKPRVYRSVREMARAGRKPFAGYDATEQQLGTPNGSWR